MKEIVRDVFAVNQVDRYREGRIFESYRYLSYPSQFLGTDPEELDLFIERLIVSLRERQALIKKLRATPVDIIKDDLSPNTYKKIENGKIENIYQLRRSIHRRYDGNIFSKISGVGKKNGAEIISALEKHNLWVNLSTDRWE